MDKTKIMIIWGERYFKHLPPGSIRPRKLSKKRTEKEQNQASYAVKKTGRCQSP